MGTGPPRCQHLFPFPELAVVTARADDGIRAIIAAPRQTVVDFYYQRIHDGWTIEPLTIADTETRFRMTSDDRLADVVLASTAQGAGDGVIEISVVFQNS